MIVVADFPKTANGKLDRKALPSPPQADRDVDADADDVAGSGTVASTRLSVETSVLTEGLGGGVNGSARLMTDHICSIIQKLRGRKPKPTSTFASIGVDSLGAILFIKQLSSSLDGMHIDPSMIYAKGVTIASVAASIADKLATDNPMILDRMRATRDEHQASRSRTTVAPTLENIESGLRHRQPESSAEYRNTYGNDDANKARGDADDDDGEDDDDDDDEDPNTIDESFEELIVTNRRLIEGLRGVFTIMVLVDHWKPPGLDNPAIISDTSLFVLMSGFTTALQLRETPVFKRRKGDKGRKAMRKGKDGDDEDDYAISGDRYRRELQPRMPFNWGKFLLSRAVGIFPILWLGMSLNFV
jgi:Phosphopantetheine attachment site